MKRFRVPVKMEWTTEAACIGASKIMFPDEGDLDAVEVAKRVCAACWVRGECLDYALSIREEHGVWGGMSTVERRRFLRRRAREARRVAS